MTGSKLTIADKKEILRLYCETDVSTTQLAKQYGISSSTVLRLLQELMSPDEYKQIVSLKQARAKKPVKAGATDERIDVINQLNLISINESFASEPDQVSQLQLDSSMPVMPSDNFSLNLDKRSDRPNYLESQSSPVDKLFTEPESSTFMDNDDLESIGDLESEDITDDLLVNDIIGDEFDDDSDDDLLDEDDEDEDDELDDLENIPSLRTEHFKIDPTSVLKILPLGEAMLPDTCYIVIDKVAELITKPLQDFRDLGKIPPEETQSLTMPVFNNHHIARRFSNHNQRVIKFPGELIHATHTKLVQKGITRLLFDGQVYAL